LDDYTLRGGRTILQHVCSYLSEQNSGISEDVNLHQHQDEQLKFRENHVTKYNRLIFHTMFPLPAHH
jgi:FtsZ-binding cell division protein ZapB